MVDGRTARSCADVHLARVIEVERRPTRDRSPSILGARGDAGWLTDHFHTRFSAEPSGCEFTGFDVGNAGLQRHGHLERMLAHLPPTQSDVDWAFISNTAAAPRIGDSQKDIYLTKMRSVLTKEFAGGYRRNRRTFVDGVCYAFLELVPSFAVIFEKASSFPANDFPADRGAGERARLS